MTSIGGLPTGLPSLDKATGGLWGMTYLAAETGNGKSSLATFAILSALKRFPDLSAFVYWLDRDRTSFFQGLLACESGYHYRSLREALKRKDQKIVDAALKLKNEILPRIRIVERPTAQQPQISVKQFKSDCQRLLDESHAKQALIVVDLFQRVAVHDANGTSGLDLDHHRIDLLADIRESTRSSNFPSGFPMLVLSGIRKGDAHRRELTIEDIPGSIQIGQSADNILLMWEPAGNHKAAQDVVPRVLRVEKARDGGTKTDVQLMFDHSRCRFFEPGSGPSKAGRPAEPPPATAARALNPMGGK